MVIGYQREFNGLTFGDGTDYPIVTETGLDGFSLRVGDREVPRGDGSLPGLHLRESKELFVELELASDTGTGVEALLADVKAAFTPQRTSAFLPYVFEHGDGVEYFVRARPTRIETRRDASTNWITTVPIALSCVDPFVYASTPGSLQLVSTDGSVESDTINNTGRLDAQVEIQVTESDPSGVILDVVVENLTTGVTFTYLGGVAPASIDPGEVLSLQAGDQSPFRSVGEDWLTHDGQPPDLSAVPSWQAPRVPITLTPGSNSIRFTPTIVTSSSTATMDLRFHPTF